MNYLICVAIGYLIGTFNMAYVFAKSKGFDIKSKGTNNAGASNATITMGWKIGICVALIDISKAVVAIAIVRLLYPNVAVVELVTGVATVIGHIYPFYMKFNGGKGFAAYMGFILAMDWRAFLVLALLSIVITLLTNYIAIATLACVMAYPVYRYKMDQNLISLAILMSLMAIIVYKHRSNVARIYQGKEIGLRHVRK